MEEKETYEPAFIEPPGTNLALVPIEGLQLPSPWVSYGRPYYESCAKHVKDTFQASRVYIIASGSLAKNTDHVDRLISAIGKEKVVGVRKGMIPHTLWSDVLSITAECRDAKADCVVTLGAGSLTDGAKLVVLCLANDIRTCEQLARYSVESSDIPNDIKQPIVPLIAIPTSLSGGEYFSLAGGTEDSTHHKHGFLYSGMGAKLIILDPELCATTPDYHWLSSGFRAIDHCVEALCSLHATPKSDENAKKGLILLAAGLLKCKADPKDVLARHRCQLGPLGVPHGITSCIMCPAVMKYNLKHGSSNPSIADRQSKVMYILWSEPEVATTFERTGLSKGSADLGDLLDAVVRALGLPRTLKELDVSGDLIPALSKRALDDLWAPTNPVPLLKVEQVQEILEAVA